MNVGFIGKIRKIYDSIFVFIGRRRLSNHSPYIVCNNCMGGMMYHWLGLEFTSPFINCSMYNEDFITALENYQDFMNYDITEDIELSGAYGFPVAIGAHNTHILFIHYSSFFEAKEKWNIRKSRMPREIMPDGKYFYQTDHLAIMLTWGGADNSILMRFSNLPFRHKVAFTNRPEDKTKKDCYYIRDFDTKRGLWQTADRKFAIKRVINEYDWVRFLNESSS